MARVGHLGGILQVSLAGNATGVVTQQWYGDSGTNKVQLNARVRRIVLRGTGGITAISLKLVHRNYAVSDGMTFSSIPEENIVAAWNAVPVTASSTVVFLDDSIASEPRAQSSLALVASVTAGSAYTVVGYIDMEQ